MFFIEVYVRVCLNEFLKQDTFKKMRLERLVKRTRIRKKSETHFVIGRSMGWTDKMSQFISFKSCRRKIADGKEIFVKLVHKCVY